MLRELWIRFQNDEAGATTVEYCLIAAGVGLVVFGAVQLFKPGLRAIFGNIAADGRYILDNSKD